MPKYIINGDFLCMNLTGIERFAYELCANLDLLLEGYIDKKDFVGIFIPANAKLIPNYKNISVFVSDKNLKSVPKWSIFVYGNFLRKQKAIGIDFANTTSLISPGISFVHDIYCKLYPNDFKGFKDKLLRKYSCFLYWYVAKFAKKIFTVSKFSQEQFSKIYHVSKDKIKVIPNGWDHLKKVQADYKIFEKNPKLQGDFYFSLGSLSKRKNLKWILNYASNHEDDIFAISGKMFENLVPAELKDLKSLDNVILLGYVSDGEVKALMSKCKAFIFPSYYEGFGIPPLEALSCGAEIVISNASCLPEIYGKTAHYISPDNADVNLEEILKNPVEPPDGVLEKFTYANAAKKFFCELTTINL